jgi:hypothetical protein
MSRVLVCFSLMLLTASLTGCANRGEFVPNACPGYFRFVDARAASAIYFDSDLQQIGKEENLQGTYFKMICGSKALSGNTDACACGTCDTVVKLKHYCLSCTRNPCP